VTSLVRRSLLCAIKLKIINYLNEVKKEAKKELIKHLIKLVNTRGWFIEASAKMETLLSTSRVPVVTDEDVIQKILGIKKAVEMQKDGYYTRFLSKANKRITKRIYGKLK
jgi:uncharacterized radical SAM superfamily protein